MYCEAGGVKKSEKAWTDCHPRESGDPGVSSADLDPCLHRNDIQWPFESWFAHNLTLPVRLKGCSMQIEKHVVEKLIQHVKKKVVSI